MCFVDIAREHSEALVKRLSSEGGGVPHYMHCDLRDIEALRACIAEAGARQIADRQCLAEKLYPADIARMALFLASDDSRMCTSQNYIVDGGWV